MGRTRLLRFAHLARASLAVLLLMGGPASAQDLTEPALKAAFIYNFALFTEWPADLVPAGGPFVICVIGDAAVRDALQREVRDRVRDGHRIAVPLVPATGGQQACQILYVSGVTPRQAAPLIADLRDLPVLTISDVEGFTEMGGIAQFFFEDGRLCFDVHIPSAKRARLQISSRLLSLAKPK